MIRECSGKQDDLNWASTREEVLHPEGLIAQTILIQHIVGFVQHEYFNMCDVNNLAPHEIRHGSRCANYDLGSDIRGISWKIVFYCVFCLHIGEFTHRNNNRHNLASKFTRRR